MVYAEDCVYKQGLVAEGTRKIYEWNEVSSKQGRFISTYKGSFSRGLSEGIGVYRTPFLLYLGEFEANQFSGRGKLTIYDKPQQGDSWVFEGLFREGEFV